MFKDTTQKLKGFFSTVQQSLPSVPMPKLESLEKVTEKVKETSAKQKASLGKLQKLVIPESLFPSKSVVVNPKYYRENVDLLAGLSLAQKVDSDLNEIHKYHSQLVVKAEMTDRKIPPVYIYCLDSIKLFDSFVSKLQSLPKIAFAVQQTKLDIEKVCSRISELEDILSQEIEMAAAYEIQIFQEIETFNTQRKQEQSTKELQEFELILRIEEARRLEKQIELERLLAQKQLEQQKVKTYQT